MVRSNKWSGCLVSVRYPRHMVSVVREGLRFQRLVLSEVESHLFVLGRGRRTFRLALEVMLRVEGCIGSALIDFISQNALHFEPT